MTIIYKDLHQFSSYIPPIDLTFNQYLLTGDGPLLVHTGDVQQAEGLVPQLETILGNNALKYIFISHFESDECGGLGTILKHFPQAKPVCSEVTARQLAGFGITNDVIIKKAGDKLVTKDGEFEFINYPSEMHLWEGLLLIENKRKILFSSDLMFEFGDSKNVIIKSDISEEIDSINKEQIPSCHMRKELQKSLRQLDIEFIATGHGPCIEAL